jgi:hypothetical protein
VNGELISQRHDAQEAATELGHRPESEAVVFLWFTADWILNDANAHLLAEVRSAR